MKKRDDESVKIDKDSISILTDILKKSSIDLIELLVVGVNVANLLATLKKNVK